jgi:hypothetical protein
MPHSSTDSRHGLLRADQAQKLGRLNGIRVLGLAKSVK